MRREAKIDPKSRKVSNAPDGYQKIRVHLIFAVKHYWRHKARLVAGGHLTPDPIESIYSGVVSIRFLRLVIFLAKLNNLEVWGADIGNAYLEANTKEKLYVVAGPEFEELEGHILVIYKSLYGLRSSGLRWAQRIHDIMLDMGFSPCNKLFLLQKEIDAPYDNLIHQDTHIYEEQNQDDIIIHANILSHTFVLPQFMAQHNCEDLNPIDTSHTVPTAFQASSNRTFNPK